MKKSFKELLFGSDDGIDYDRKCEFIRNYIVPRTKEDSIEFAILAKSNIEVQLYKKKTFLISFMDVKVRKNIT